MGRAASLVLVVALALLGCGDDEPYCGDGVVQAGEQCDDGNDDQTDYCQNCRTVLPAQLTIKWAFNKMAAPMFDNDGCLDMGAATVDVELVGPESREASESCSFRQVVFSGLPAGSYLVRITPRDVNGESLIGAPVEATVAYGGQSMEHEVVVPYEAWTRSYTGTFFFRVTWAGADCGAAGPPVAQQVLRLERGGSSVGGSTKTGVPLDGSAGGPCIPFADEFPQSALMVPWGPATFTITGLDQGGEAQFEETFETFVGAGVSNPELHFDVASLAPDAGVPDAGPADGGPDGG